MKRRNFLGLVAATAAVPLVPSAAKEPKDGFLIQDHWKETITDEDLCKRFGVDNPSSQTLEDTAGLDYNKEVERMRFEYSMMPVGTHIKGVLAEKVLLCDHLEEPYLPSYEGPSH